MKLAINPDRGNQADPDVSSQALSPSITQALVTATPVSQEIGWFRNQAEICQEKRGQTQAKPQSPPPAPSIFTPSSSELKVRAGRLSKMCQQQ